MYKDLKFVQTVQVTVEDYYEACVLMAQYNLSWEEFGHAVHVEYEGFQEMGEMCIFVYDQNKYYFAPKTEGILAKYQVAGPVRFEITQPQSVRVEDV